MILADPHKPYVEWRFAAGKFWWRGATVPTADEWVPLNLAYRFDQQINESTLPREVLWATLREHPEW